MANNNKGTNSNNNASNRSVGNTNRVTLPPPPVDPTPLAAQSCYTQTPVINFRFKWTITNFSYCHKETGESLKSSTFFVKANDKLKWCLVLYPRGKDEESKDYMSLFLLLVSYNKSSVRAKFKFSILNEKREATIALESGNAFCFFPEKDWGYRSFLRRDFVLANRNNLLPDDTLTIFCEVCAVEDPVNISGHRNVAQLRVPECRLSDDFGVMFESQLFSDVTFVVAGKEYPAHKAVLAARSTVFAALFKHEIKEKTDNRVEITDMKAYVLEEMFRFIYTGKSNNLKTMAADLLAAAAKYALKRLKEMCEEALYRGLCVDNAAEILIFAHRHSSDQLKAKTIKFMTAHAADVMDTSGWKTMAKCHSNLLQEALRAFSTQPITLIVPSRKRRRLS